MYVLDNGATLNVANEEKQNKLKEIKGENLF